MAELMKTLWGNLLQDNKVRPYVFKTRLQRAIVETKKYCEEKNERELWFCPRLMKGFCLTAVMPKIRTAIPAIYPTSGRPIKQRLLMFVFFQNPVRQIAMSDQLYRASIFLAQPLFGHIRSGMVM